jgi:glycosyltransferase involved in cell wall biosynthesis
MNIAYIGFPQYELDCKWSNHFEKGNKVIFLNSPLDKSAYRFLSPSIKVFEVLPSTFPFTKIFLKRKILKKIRSILLKENIDIIHSLYAIPNSFWAFELGFKNHIITTRGSDILIDYDKTFKNPSTFKEKIIYRYLRKKFENTVNAAKYITSTSTKQIQVLEKFMQDPSKLNLIRTGIDITKFSVPKKSHIQDPDDRLIIFSPRVNTPLYNIELIIEAFSLFKIRNPFLALELILIDYFPGTAYSILLSEKISALNLAPFCRILSMQTEAQMVQLYLECSIVISVPKSDGTPNSVLEAMLAKRPVILSNLDYDLDLFNNKTIWKLSENTPEELAEKLSEIHLMEITRLEEKLNFAHLTVVEKANLDTECDKIQILYQRMLSH